MSGTVAAHSVGTTSTSLNIREGSGTNYGVLKTAQAYTGVYLTAGPVDNDGYRWWKVQVNACDCGGREWGWVVERYIDHRDMSWPATGTIVSGAVFDSSRGSSKYQAVDINAPGDNPVRAAESRTVQYANNFPDCGLTIKTDHGGGWHTQYCHCSASHVRAGDYVYQKQYIAEIGTSGSAYSRDPHVHFEVEYPEYYERDPGAEIGHHVWSRTGYPNIDM